MFSKPFSFKGRIRRLEYGLSFIIWYIYIILCSFTAVAAPIFMLFGLWFLFAQGTKRCHDINNPGWYQILPFYVLWMFFANGDKGANSYGGNPKGLN